jgi:hypothetical protein
MKIKPIIKTIAILIATYMCLESAYYAGLYRGYNLGASTLGNLCYPKLGNGFCGYGGDPYEQLGDLYVYVCLLLVLFLVAQMIKREIVSHWVSLISVLLAMFGFARAYTFKNNFLSDDDKYIDLIRQTISTDYVHIWLTSALVLYKIIDILVYWQTGRNNKSLNKLD